MVRFGKRCGLRRYLQEGPVFTTLFGVTHRLEAETIRQLYPEGKGDCLQRFAAAARDAAAKGFLLSHDAEEAIELAWVEPA